MIPLEPADEHIAIEEIVSHLSRFLKASGDMYARNNNIFKHSCQFSNALPRVTLDFLKRR